MYYKKTTTIKSGRGPPTNKYGNFFLLDLHLWNYLLSFNCNGKLTSLFGGKKDDAEDKENSAF